MKTWHLKNKVTKPLRQRIGPRDPLATAALVNDKLKMLDYELAFRKMKLPPLARECFAYPAVRPLEGLMFFACVFTFLSSCLIANFFNQKETDDTGVVIEKILREAKELRAPVALNEAVLTEGYGPQICDFLDWMCDQAMVAKRIGVIPLNFPIDEDEVIEEEELEEEVNLDIVDGGDISATDYMA
eukprot:Clim_evm58s134 gene=Clim_evmTU58s134